MRKPFSLALIALLALYSAMFLSALSSHVQATALRPAIHQVNCNPAPSRYVQLTDTQGNTTCYVKDGNGQEVDDDIPMYVTALSSVGYSGSLQPYDEVVPFTPGSNLTFTPPLEAGALVINAGPAS